MDSKTCYGKVSGNPLKVYQDYNEAVEASEYVLKKWNNFMTPYKCSKCDMYHLATKERQTESNECEYCTGSDGSPKQLYLTMQGAQKRADILLEEQGMRLYLYECPYQDGWHLTKKIK